MTLRIKLTLALMITSTLSALLVGGVAEWMLRRDFRNAVLNEAFSNFRLDVVNYIRLYGSWEEAAKHEDFHYFVIRNRSPQAQRSGLQVTEEGSIDRSERPPFLFLLMNEDGIVLRPISPFKEGDKAPPEVLMKSFPILIEDHVVAYAYPYGKPHLTEKDLAYFKAIREALIGGILIASVFSMVAGLVFGRRLSRSLTQLMRSISLFGEVIEKADDDLDLDSFKISDKNAAIKNDEFGRLAHAFNVMIERSIRSHKRLKDESTRDPLTGLYNRRHFERQADVLLDLSLRRGEPLCIMLADVDFFKKINDTYSHAVGDEVLKRIAAILHDNMREYDLLARYGGEEFIVLFPYSRLGDARIVCERIRQGIELYDWTQIHPDLKVTISMGISDSIDLGSIGKMGVEADKYLYLAKEKGRNRVEYPGRVREKTSIFRRLIRAGMRGEKN